MSMPSLQGSLVSTVLVPSKAAQLLVPLAVRRFSNSHM